MWLLYDLLIHLYGDAISVASLFNPKAKQWVRGRKRLFSRIESAVRSPQFADTVKRSTLNTQHSTPDAIAWFHCASLGEFEQGRPVIEAFRKMHPEWKILLTFFSPSGYEVRKNYEGADWVIYLPLDTPWNAKKFVRTVNPSLVVFVKYEYWFRYLDVLYRNKIPVYVISANFRSNHHFFKWYGIWARKQLMKVSGFFVQNEASKELLQNHGIDQVTVSGDTRFDRVAAVVSNPRSFTLVEMFCASEPVFLAGSTWQADEELVLELIKKQGARMKFIIAPHEVGEQRVRALQFAVRSSQQAVRSSQFAAGSKGEAETRNPKPGVILFSQLSEENAVSARVLIIDGIGYLSHLYKNATIAYIGGGFGAGIHNILEAAAFGKPVIFGPKFHKFREALDLIEAGGAFSINNFEQLNNRTIELLDHKPAYLSSSKACRGYVADHCGATEKILESLVSSH